MYEICEKKSTLKCCIQYKRGHQGNTCYQKTVSKVIRYCQQYRTAEQFRSGKHTTKMTDGVLQVIELAKLKNK